MAEPAAPPVLAPPVTARARTVPGEPQPRTGLPGVGAGAGARELHGLLEIAGIAVALPLSALLEVVACPRELVTLPAAAEGLLGAIELRALIVPVLDVRPLLALPHGRTGMQAVVIVAGPDRRVAATPGDGPDGEAALADAHLLGLLVDRVHGIVSVAEEDLLEFTAATPPGAALLSARAFRHPDTGAAVSVLDPDRLLAVPGVPRLRQGGAPRAPVPALPVQVASGAIAQAGTTAKTLAVLRCGPYLLALDVEHVHTTRPGAAPLPSALAGPICRGVTPYLDQDVPVVDLLALLGLPGAADGARTGAALVLEADGGYVAADLDALLDLARIDPADVVPLPAVAVGRPDLVRGIVELPGLGTCLVLDGPALRAEPTVAALARLNTPFRATSGATSGATQGQHPSRTAAGEPADGAPDSDGRPDPWAAPEYLVYTSGGIDLVTPLEQISEILPVPAELVAVGAGTEVLGVIVHRNQAVPVMSLAAALGLPSPSPTGCLLLVAGPGPALALAVDGLDAIARLSWFSDEQAHRKERPQNGLRSRPLVTVGDDGRLLPEIDLLDLARRSHAIGRT